MDELLYHTPIYRKEKGSANGLKPRCRWKIMPDFLPTEMLQMDTLNFQNIQHFPNSVAFYVTKLTIETSV